MPVEEGTSEYVGCPAVPSILVHVVEVLNFLCHLTIEPLLPVEVIVPVDDPTHIGVLPPDTLPPCEVL